MLSFINKIISSKAKSPVLSVCFIDNTNNKSELSSKGKTLINLNESNKSLVDHYSRALAHRPDVTVVLYDIDEGGVSTILYPVNDEASKVVAESVFKYVKALSPQTYVRSVIKGELGFPVLNQMKPLKSKVLIRLSSSVDVSLFIKYISRWVEII